MRLVKTGASARLRFELMAHEHAERVGARIRERRDALGLSRDEVARRMPGKTSGNQIYRWEKGEHEPRSDTMDALAKALELDGTAYFYVGGKDKPTETPDIMGRLNGASADTLKELLDGQAELRTMLAAVAGQLADIAALIAAGDAEEGASAPPQESTATSAERPARTGRRSQRSAA
jgi:transcriptional regulator with XRE-family HTH domain